MIIKSINRTFGYKGLPDGFFANFDDDITYIVGDNFKTKSTILSVPLWVLTGYNMNGGNQEDVSDDSRDIKNVIAEITIIDNEGNKHIISRSKGKNNIVLIDGVRASKEIIAKFIGDIQFFLCAYNPYRFSTLEPAKQKDLLLRLLPGITSKEAFEMLSDEEKEIIEEPIADNVSYAKIKRASIKDFNAEINRYDGIIEACIKTALMQEEQERNFEKEKYLSELKEQYDKLLTGADESLNVEDLEIKIKRMYERIKETLNVDLVKHKENKEEIENKIKSVSSITSKCPTCKQEIKNIAMQDALKNQYKHELERVENKILDIQKYVKECIEDYKNKKSLYEQLNTDENKKIEEKRKDLKGQIELLEREKHEIDLFNQEIRTRKENIRYAKEQIENANSQKKLYQEKIDLYNKQIKISDKLKMLIIDIQIKATEKYLDYVSMNFWEYDEEKKEFVENYTITYKGRDYKKLSQSEKMRADFEIAYFINKQSGIYSPMFIDDAERIREIKIAEGIQTIVAHYIKYSDLNILYDYNEVLRIKRDSIEKQLDEDQDFVWKNVA